MDPRADTRLQANGDFGSIFTKDAANHGGFTRGYRAGVCLKVENSRVAAIIGSYPAILPL